MNMNVEKVIADLLTQNAQLRLEAAILRATIEHETEIELQMAESRNLPPEAMEMLSKLDIR
jgi:regulator of replication initiation timing